MAATLFGLAKLDRKLKRMPDLAKAEIRAAMEVAAAEMVATMKNLVPVASGDLRDSIGWTWGKAPKGAGIVAQAKSKLGGDMTITVYAGNAKAFYARWQEFGTVSQPAQPYFFVSYRIHKKSAKRRIGGAIRKAAKKVAAS